MKSIIKNFRLNLTIAALLCCFSSIFAQSSTTTHIVDRGETIESIAAKYGLTTAQLIELNPGAKDFVYVGMELIVPATTPKSALSIPSTTESSSSVLMATIPTTATGAYDDSSSNNPEGPGIGLNYALEYGFLPKDDGASSNHNFAYAITLGVNYYFLEKENKVFAGAGIGYNSYSYNISNYEGHGNHNNTKIDAHCITIPIKIGYTLKTENRSLGITPLVGVDLNCIVKAKSKAEGNNSFVGNYEVSSNLKKGLAADFRIGIQLTLWGFNIGGSYVMPINDRQKFYAGEDGYFAVNIGWGF